MSVFSISLAFAAILAGAASFRFLPAPWSLLVAGTCLAFSAYALLVPEPKSGIVARLGRLTWRRSEFCRGWLITGDTGSGKTTSGINQLIWQVFKHEPTWGGLCIDEKGVYWETLVAMAARHRRSTDLIHLRIDENGNPKTDAPVHRFNLTGNRDIPYTTYAKFLVDTATSLGQTGDKGFFKTQAQTHIAHALELLYELNRPVTLRGAYELLSDETALESAVETLEDMTETPASLALIDHFNNRFLNQPEEQYGGVRETIGNYLQYFLTPEVAKVFCATESTFEMADVDRGKIICLTMPHKFQTERRYVSTFLKLLLYHHVLRGRFHTPPNDIPHVFIGSSVECLPVAQHVQTGLAHDPMLVQVWTDGVFRAAAGTIECLLKAVSHSDFAILVLAPEDTVISRKKKTPAPRDNCIFELGLFMGALGSDRVFIVKQRGANIKIPTDLLGITPVEFAAGDHASLPTRIAPVCNEIRKAVLGLGPK